MSDALSSSIGMKSISGHGVPMKAFEAPPYCANRFSTTFCFGVQRMNSYGPVPIGCVAYFFPRSVTALRERTRPLPTGSVERRRAAKGRLRTIVPEYLSLTLTSLRASQSPAYGDLSLGSAIRSYENLTSSAVNSP